MIQLKILSGKMAGTNFVARHFPIHVGRANTADLQLDDQGVWDDHFHIDLAGPEGFIVETHADALTTVNGQPAKHSALRNGDLIEIGSLKIQFWLSEAPQKALRIREAFVWLMVGAVTVLQLGLIYWLIQ